MQNQARPNKYNQNNLTMTTSPDTMAKPQLVQVNYLHSCRYVHLCICSSDWEKKCISVEAVIQEDLFKLGCAAHFATFLHASLP